VFVKGMALAQRCWEILVQGARLARRFMLPPRTVHAPIMPPYVDVRRPRRRIAKFVALPLLGLFGIVYGFYFALTAPYLIVQFLMPTVALSLLVIWALPDQRTAPFRFVRFCLSGMLIGLVLWPNYLALALPGLPWITLLRLTGIPMALGLLVCLSVSDGFRARLMATLNAIPFVWKALLVLSVMQFITLPFSEAPVESFNKSIINQVAWTSVFLTGAYMFRTPGRVSRYLTLIGLLAVPIAALSMLEFFAQRILWEGYVPSFLKIDELDKYVTAEFRPGTNVYRAKATFSTALGLAEYMALVTPLFLYFTFQSKRALPKILGALGLLGIFYSIEISGSRLGFAGMGVACLGYLLFWAMQRQRRLRSDLIAPAVIAGYPFVFGATLVASLFVNAINNAVWGGGEHAGSNQARRDQLTMAIPKLLQNPIGHGSGMAGESLGFTVGNFITVDNYYITIAMDYGVVGLIAHFGMFLVAIAYASRYGLFYAPRSKDKETVLLLPLALCLTVFVVIKIVFSQPENHPIVYLMLGMVVALVYRLKQEPGLVPAPPEARRGGSSTVRA
jgi:hypothetical protein